MTASILEDVPAYSPIVGLRAAEGIPQDEADGTRETTRAGLKSVLLVLEALDRAWYSVLSGRQVFVMPLRLHANQSVERALLRRRAIEYHKDIKGPEGVRRAHQHVAYRIMDTDRPSHPASPSLAEGEEVWSDDGSDIEALTSSRYLAMHPPGKSKKATSALFEASVARDSRPVLGGLGQRSVPQTDRVRLRNIIVQGKEPVFAWMRRSLGGPPPPRQIDEVYRTLAAAGASGFAPSSENNQKFYKTLQPSQHVKDLFVDQGNLGEGLSPRAELLSASEPASPSGSDSQNQQNMDPQEAPHNGARPVPEVQPEEELSAYRSALESERKDEASYLRRYSQQMLPSPKDADSAEGIDQATLEGGADMKEREHYAALFDRPLDPDADDESEEAQPNSENAAGDATSDAPLAPQGSGNGGAVALEAINQRSAAQLGDKRPADQDSGDEEWEDVATTKRTRHEQDPFTTDQKELEESAEAMAGLSNQDQDAVHSEDEDQDAAHPGEADDQNEDEGSPYDTPPTPGKEAQGEQGGGPGWTWRPLPEWDLAFSKTFHRTLRTLNDMDDPLPPTE